MASLLALLCTLAFAPSASAQAEQVEYDCVLPGGGTSRVYVTWVLTLPTTANVGTPLPTTKVDMPMNFPQELWDLADARDVASIEVVGAKSKLDVSLASTSQPGFDVSVSGPPISTTGARSRLAFSLLEGTLSPFTFQSAGTAQFNAAAIRLNLRFRDAAGRAVPMPATEADSDGDPGTVDVRCTPFYTPSLVATVAVFQFNDATPPSRPGKPVIIGGPTSTMANLQWAPSTDDVSGISRYVIRWSDGWSESTTTTGWAGAMMPNRDHAVTIVAYDRAGNGSQPSEPVIVRTKTGTTPPEPTNIRFTPTGPGTATVSWDRPVDPRGEITGYEVVIWDDKGNVQDGYARIGGSPTSAKFTGLPPRSKRLIRVWSWGVTTARSFPEDINWVAPITYGASTTAQFSRLTSRPFDLGGQLSLQSDPDGTLRPNLTFKSGRARLKVLGVIPVTADVSIVPVAGEQTATYEGEVLVATARVKVRLPQVYLFGAIPVPAADSCQTRRYTELSLTSNIGFNLIDGGVLRGNLPISDLTGCGALNTLISPLTASEGNPIEARLAPQG